MLNTTLPVHTVLLFCALTIALPSCQSDDGAVVDDDANKGRLRVSLTDAPADDPRIVGVYITVDHVALDGEEVEGLSVRRTVDIMKYQNGRTLQLGGEAILTAGQYGPLSIALDHRTDDQGQSPGCYALLRDGSKVALPRPDREPVSLRAAGPTSVEALEETYVVADFDLRKAIRRGPQGGYKFSVDVETAATRFVDGNATGTILGEVSGAASVRGAATVMYVFPKGTYDREAAIASDFAEAYASARIVQGEFSVAFVPEGEYDLVAASYHDADGDGRTELSGTFITDAVIGLETRSVAVSARTEVSVDVTLGELVGLGN